jgi:hypothetical protein
MNCKTDKENRSCDDIAFLSEMIADFRLWQQLGFVYRGFTISAVGRIIGFFWALVDGLIGGAIFAWLYKLFSARILSSES